MITFKRINPLKFKNSVVVVVVVLLVRIPMLQNISEIYQRFGQTTVFNMYLQTLLLLFVHLFKITLMLDQMQSFIMSFIVNIIK